SFSEQDYSDFRNFLVERGFSYRTLTESSLNELIATAKREKYYDIHKDLFTQLENQISHSLDHDLAIFRQEITELIEDEVISRYFYEEGAIAWSVKKDQQVLRALEILNNPPAYNSILRGQSVPGFLTRDNEKAEITAFIDRSRPDLIPV
ncbi:MAG TPA: hypothetical protein DCY25_03750, partial [Bacteroidales bacterium]|nr:hypothetical protein [Bacteroidales bacterium]